MIELIGLIFGGVSRLAQHWLDLADKQKERDHEARMFEQQALLADKRFAHDADLRQMDAASQEAQGEWTAMAAAIDAQAREARAAGGWVAKLSASVRPVLAYWFVLIYTCAKAAGLYLALKSGVPLGEAIRATYTEFDGAVLASVISFFFADRSLRKK